MKCTLCLAELPQTGGPHRPFCSARCQLIDLGNWLGERYIVAGEKAPPDAASNTVPVLSDE